MPGTPPLSVIAQTNPIFNPGFYFLDFPSTADLSEIVGEPAFKGACLGFKFRELEPTFGNYDFSKIDAKLTELAGKQLIIFVRIKNFQTATESYMPAYMDNNIATYGGGPINGGTYLAGKGNYGAIWNANVMSRWTALVNALGAAYGNNTQVEGVFLHETAWRRSEAQTYPDYTLAGFKQAFYTMADSVKTAFPRQQILQGMNFNFGNTAQDFVDFKAHLLANNIGAGCPDVRPADAAGSLGDTYTWLADNGASIPTFPQNQYGNYEDNVQDGEGRPSDVFDWVKTNLPCWYYGFSKNTQQYPDNTYPTFWSEVLDVVRTEQNPPLAKIYYANVAPPDPGDTLTFVSVTPTADGCTIKVTPSSSNGKVYVEVLQRTEPYVPADDVTDGTGAAWHGEQDATGAEMTFVATGLSPNLPHQIGAQQIDATPAIDKNHFAYSSDLSQWDSDAATITGDLIEGSVATAGRVYVNDTVTLPAGDWCFWLECSASDATTINRYIATRGVPMSTASSFDFLDMVSLVTGGTSDGMGAITATGLGNGWVQVAQTFNLASETAVTLGVYLAQSNSSTWLTDRSLNAARVRHLQLNPGTTPTAKTVTTGTPIT